MNDTYLYPYSSAEARERNELSLWRESHKANIACRNAIEDTIRQNFDGMHLHKDCLTPVLEEYGYKRTAWVLANTLHELKWDGRFGHANKQWAEKIYIPTDLNQQRFCCPKPSGCAGWLRQFLPQGGAGSESLRRGALCR